MIKWLLCFCLVQAAFAEETAPETLDVAKISEAMGHLIGKNLQSLGLNVDINAVVKGMQDAAEGKSSPLSEDECVLGIASLQEESLAMLAEKNLQEATQFLEKNKTDESIVSLEEGKLQYKVLEKGTGEAVQAYSSPIVQYKASYLNGQIFGASNGDELLSLDEAIPGFTKGIIGMQEGETRTLYIHPELGYGKQGQLSPNSLLIFEVKVVKVDATADAHAASNAELAETDPIR